MGVGSGRLGINLSVGDLGSKAVDDGERGLLPVGVGRAEELGQQLVVLVAQVCVQRGRPLLRAARSQRIKRSSIDQQIKQQMLVSDMWEYNIVFRYTAF